MPFRVVFVCSGNICRSPMAEYVFRSLLRDAGLDGVVAVSSAGTGDWHVGQGADHRAVAALNRRGYDGSRHEVQQYLFAGHDLVIALARTHERFLRALAPDDAARDRVRLLRSFDPAAQGHDLDVPDPYYGDDADFEHVLDLVESACTGLVEEVRRALVAR